MELQDALKFMLEDGYMTTVRGKYVVTKKFNEQVRNVEEGLIHVSGIPIVLDIAHQAKDLSKVEWKNMYIRFIQDAKIPARCEGSNGASYDCNKYSEDGMKAFKTYIKDEGIDLRVLLAVTQLYYAKWGTHKQMIGTYISQGTWRNEYVAMLDAASIGDTNAIQEHIKQELKNDRPYTSASFG
jgi:hypothetical protein